MEDEERVRARRMRSHGRVDCRLAIKSDWNICRKFNILKKAGLLYLEHNCVNVAISIQDNYLSLHISSIRPLIPLSLQPLPHPF